MSEGIALLLEHVSRYDATEARVECARVFFTFHPGTHAVADAVLIAAHE